MAERPGASASEHASAAGIASPVVYPVLKTLEEAGEVIKEQLPSGTAGYRLTSAALPESAT